MLEFSNVSFRYPGGVPALKEVSLTIRPGEFVAIAGRNGSGKTTLTKLMISLLKPSSGSICLNGNATAKLLPADLAPHIGYVFQNPDRQIFRDTVEAEVAYGPQQLGFAPERIKAAVAQALETVGLTDLAKAYPRSLSKGQKQKVTIASALAMQPEILILDEPTSGQDARAGKQLMELLKKMHAQGKTIIMVTHNMELLAGYAQRAIIMDQGQKAFDGTITELFAEPREVKKWGLREPSAAVISRGLADYNVPVTSDVQKLAAEIAKRMGRHTHAKACTAE